MNSDENSFSKEIIGVSIALIILLLFGYLVGYPWLFFSFGLAIYIFWHLRQLSLLIRWLENNALDMPPDSHGFWGDVFRHLYRIQRHNRHRHEKLLVLLNRYKESTEAMPDATIILSRNWEIEWLNNKCEDFLGLQPRQDVGQLLTNLIRTPMFLDFLKSTENHADTKNNVLEMISPDNQKNLSIRLVPFGKKHLLIARDITKIQQLREVRKDFVANVSHELRTPLTVISGYLETLGDHLKDDALYSGSITHMQQQSNRMCRIIEDLLLLSKIEGKEKRDRPVERVNMPALIMMLKKEAMVLSDNHHTIHVEVEDIQWLQGDENELRSAFTNLVSNAIRYTPPGGDITIRWYRGENKNACFEVEDSGEGIAQKHIARLTERFYRVDVGRSRSSGGTGLGLAIVKHVLNHHEARLVIKSELNVGSVFRCEFPAKLLNE
jgi:two-component system phosphate regulon sensor histidine kinase PhoR